LDKIILETQILYRILWALPKGLKYLFGRCPKGLRQFYQSLYSLPNLAKNNPGTQGFTAVILKNVNQNTERE
jgi:hypothetical protein